VTRFIGVSKGGRADRHGTLNEGRRGAPNWLRGRSRKPVAHLGRVGSSPTPSAKSRSGRYLGSSFHRPESARYQGFQRFTATAGRPGLQGAPAHGAGSRPLAAGGGVSAWIAASAPALVIPERLEETGPLGVALRREVERDGIPL
jgi:hypothetical protein